MTKSSPESVRWHHATLVALLALATTAAQCGHDSAGESTDESAKAVEEQAESDEPTESTSGDEEEAAMGESSETDVQKSAKKRLEPSDVDAETLRKLGGNIRSFGFDLYAELTASRADENLVYSPYNLSTVLAMIYAGADGETADQMKGALGFELAEPKLHRAVNALDRRVTATGKSAESEGDRVETANGLWAQKKMALRPAFLDTLATNYGAGVQNVDYRTSSESARQRINEWVAEKTNDKIRNLLPKGSIDRQTRLVLTAAIYFRGQWSTPFEAEQTDKADFANLSGETTRVDMMHNRQRQGYGFAKGKGFRAVELPYTSGEYSMVVLLPNEGKFGKVEGRLGGEMAGKLFEKFRPTPVDLRLPKFKVTGRFSGREALSGLGMARAFTPDADFSGISAEEELFVDDVLHKAYLSVDEKGTEAAAASAGTMSVTGMMPGEKEFETVTVDRPFIVMIRHMPTDAVLFVGRVVNL